jgi:hypothetical protein
MNLRVSESVRKVDGLYTASNNSLIVVCISVVGEMCLPILYHATDNHTYGDSALHVAWVQSLKGMCRFPENTTLIKQTQTQISFRDFGR